MIHIINTRITNDNINFNVNISDVNINIDVNDVVTGATRARSDDLR